MQPEILLPKEMLDALRAFANANAGSKVGICTTPVTTIPATQTALAAMTYVNIRGVGSFGETGLTTNILTYDTWDTDVVQKAKGMSDAGSPELEVARNAADAGQIALRAAAATNMNYAIRIERNDKLTTNGNNSMVYNVGLVAGPRNPNGRNEDFDLDIYTFGFQQAQITVPAT